ncbi:LacI family DNA-binding transcriptional regulator [Petroclostridium sp. X23]|uniref:LacI family DNA-binding transcriptional regulator n=1 Tax=Petroclostridium sp. X23 TaxID=3045146 RepID=UPI0024ADDD68|nr:LacI family DNA-binding transcriptional regulator [Petroclostridium sp. X23]WHH59042.1 LacI family DNA-binding transcriptional regulator [Petroclostridium sp. X23]
MKKNTINDIAKLAGVSRSTVSRVLTNNPNVNPITREKIQKIIDTYNYHPNSLARGLVLGKIDVIALIIGDIRNPFYSEMTWVIENILNQNGYMVVLCDSEYMIEKEELYLEAAKQYGFAGVVLTSALENDRINAAIKSLTCPVILLNRYIKSFEGDVVITDNFQGGYIATKHLIELGHTKIAILTGPINSTSSLERFNGYKSALETFGLEYCEDLVAYGDLKMETGYKYGCTLLEKDKDLPTAVVAGNDLMAIGIMEAYQKAGMSIPEHLSIIGYDDIPISSITSINLTTVRQPFYQMGEIVPELLLKQINNEQYSHRKIILTPELIVRETTKSLY